MRQVWIAKTGVPGVLHVRESPDPTPKPGEVRVRVAASGVNFADVMIRIGIYPHAPKLPAVIGYEVAGEIDAFGDDVKDFQNGMRVVAMTPRYGGYSEYVTLPADEVLPIPDTLSFEKAAAVPVNYLTAWLMLVHLGNVQSGDRVLIHAAAGGVGQAALQLCLWRGASVIGTASAAKHGRLLEMGVAHAIDYRTEDFEAAVQNITQGEGVDIVLDSVGGNSFARSYRCLSPLGRLFMFGASSMAPSSKRNLAAVLKSWIAMPRFNPLKLIDDNKIVAGVSLGHLGRKAGVRMSMLREIMDLVAQGVLDPVVDRTFRFDQAAEAHTYIQDRKNFGKVVLVP